MFSRKNKAERTAAQAWDYLSSAMAAAGESAREAGRHTADVASATALDLADRASSTSGKLADKATSTGGKLADRATSTGGKLADKASKKSSKLVDKAGKKGSKLTDTASRKAGAAGNEAWARANAAASALAGRKQGRPWGLIIGFSLIGVAVGWAAATTARAALERQAENEELELAETAVIVTPTYDD
jgi:hypothetical protein